MVTVTGILFFLAIVHVFADDCGGEKFKDLGNGVIMRCRKGVWKVSKRSQPKGPPCSDDPSLAANGTCSADRGHCQQYTVAGADMDRDCPETCESCDACRCQDASQWHAYCGYWSQYCGSSGVLGNWMTSNCRKTCGACRCKCCSYKGKQHQLGARIQLPEKCGELVCEEGLVADYSPLLKGAADHKVSHPEELTLNFRSVHTGADCCILPGNARSTDGSSFPNGTMVQEGWAGVVEHRGAGISASCCHGILSTPLDDTNQISPTTTTLATRTTTISPATTPIPTTSTSTVAYVPDMVIRLTGTLAKGWRVGPSYMDAIDLTASSNILVRGISLFGSVSATDTRTGKIQLKETDSQKIIISENFKFTSNGKDDFFDHIFSSPGNVRAGVKYTATLEYADTQRIYRGTGGLSTTTAACNGRPVNFEFFKSKDDNNGSGTTFGQIPRILISC